MMTETELSEKNSTEEFAVRERIGVFYPQVVRIADSVRNTRTERTQGRLTMENVAYFGGAENAHGIAYSRSAFHQMSRLTKHHRSQLKDALMSMRSDDSNDEVLTGSRRTRRLEDGLRFVFERNGSALTVLAITDAGFPPQAKDTPP